MAIKKVTGKKLAKKREVLPIRELGMTPLGEVMMINGKMYLRDYNKKTKDGIPIYDGETNETGDGSYFVEITKEDLKFLKEELDGLVDKLEDKVNVKKLLFQLVKDWPIEQLRKINKLLEDPNTDISEHNGCYELRFNEDKECALHFGGRDVFGELEK